MVKLNVIYPQKSGAHFNMDYYVNSHMALVKRLLGPALKGISVDEGMSGMEPGSPAPFVAIAGLLFDSVESMQTASAPHVEKLHADVPNFTDIQPVFQVSEVKL